MHWLRCLCAAGKAGPWHEQGVPMSISLSESSSDRDHAMKKRNLVNAV
jgi:hypothetical protein